MTCPEVTYALFLRKVCLATVFYKIFVNAFSCDIKHLKNWEKTTRAAGALPLVVSCVYLVISQLIR